MSINCCRINSTNGRVIYNKNADELFVTLPLINPHMASVNSPLKNHIFSKTGAVAVPSEPSMSYGDLLNKHYKSSVALASRTPVISSRAKSLLSANLTPKIDTHSSKEFPSDRNDISISRSLYNFSQKTDERINCIPKENIAQFYQPEMLVPAIIHSEFEPEQFSPRHLPQLNHSDFCSDLETGRNKSKPNDYSSPSYSTGELDASHGQVIEFCGFQKAPVRRQQVQFLEPTRVNLSFLNIVLNCFG